jgi:hypothetical protein
MSDSPSVQQILGLPAEIKVGEKVWKLGPPNQRAKAILEELFAGDAVEEAMRLERSMPPAVWQKHDRMVLARIDAKEYATGGDGWLAKFGSPATQHLFVLSLFRVNHSDMTAEDLKKVSEVAGPKLEAALVRQVPGFFDVLFPNMTPEQREQLGTTFQAAVANLRTSSSAV